ncbi:MAG TPA: hypothetical protein VGI10_20585 [Polyangiaceae bacterium]|jgi:hypothetical protein
MAPVYAVSVPALALVWILLGCTARSSPAGGSAGNGAAGNGAAGRSSVCPAKPQTQCSGTGTPPAYESIYAPCDQQGNVCSGGDLAGDEEGCFIMSWNLQCCSGMWYPTVLGDGGVPEVCPSAGTPFPCGTDPSLSCVDGQNACAESLDLATSARTYMCSSLCAAADCSCFCTPGAQGGCSYTIADPTEPSNCQCGVARGEVDTFCTHGTEPTYGCTRDPGTDATCDADHPVAFLCTSPDGGQVTPQGTVCQQLDNDPKNHWCCTTT